MDNERSLAKEITEGFEALKSMRNNEPVAWMQVHDKDNKPTKFSLVKTWKDDIPLYTHLSEHDLGIAEAIGFDKGYKAATVKELTDEEILACWSEEFTSNALPSIDFARAILRKAQEK